MMLSVTLSDIACILCRRRQGSRDLGGDAVSFRDSFFFRGRRGFLRNASVSSGRWLCGDGVDDFFFRGRWGSLRDAGVSVSRSNMRLCGDHVSDVFFGGRGRSLRDAGVSKRIGRLCGDGVSVPRPRLLAGSFGGAAPAPTVDALNEFVFAQIFLRDAADASAAEGGALCLYAPQTTETFVARALPLGDEVFVCVFFAQTPFVEFLGDGLAFVVHLVNVAGALVVDAEDGPQRLTLALALVRLSLRLPHSRPQLLQRALQQLPSGWRPPLLVQGAYPRHLSFSPVGPSQIRMTAVSQDIVHRVPSGGGGQCRSAMEIACQTDVEYDTVIFNWRVNNFRRMRAMSIEKGIPPEGDVITSPIYVDVQGGQWWLRLYPYEDREEHRGKVSLFLHTDRATKGDVFFSFHFSALNEAGLPIEDTAGGIDLHKFEKSDGIRNFGFYDLIENNETIEKALIDNHALWLFCEVYIYSSLVTSLDDVHDVRVASPSPAVGPVEEKPPLSSLPPRQSVARKASLRQEVASRGVPKTATAVSVSRAAPVSVSSQTLPWKQSAETRKEHAPLRHAPTLGSAGMRDFTAPPRSSPLSPSPNPLSPSPSPLAPLSPSPFVPLEPPRPAPQMFTQPAIPLVFRSSESKSVLSSTSLRPSLGTLPNTLTSPVSAGSNGFRFTLQPPGPR
eukprot:Gregarina_sp_Pseudo_9__952@NODE_160_length_3914_cov_163_681290_g147_i0_p1_GENE_NODE_160_length_3914_cov_163_681290_g147_i0NODE_160_length_3914_cov_163_681290_g147_i0_p1_ORF_typecomplete_len673_score191_32MATH/PF00917_26/3_5e06_NODE_160_length_3914_cov_163_681290_g147_i012693287